MNQSEWIVCERRGRWAAALRVMLTRQDTAPREGQRLHEVRTLEEMAARLAERPDSLALVEVDRANLSKVLRWLTDAARGHSGARFVALLDRTLQRPATSDRTPQKIDGQNIDGQDVVAALFEAGVVEVAISPRHLQHVRALAEQHAATLAARRPSATEGQSIVEWAWSLLPWQSEESQVG